MPKKNALFAVAVLCTVMVMGFLSGLQLPRRPAAPTTIQHPLAAIADGLSALKDQANQLQRDNLDAAAVAAKLRAQLYDQLTTMLDDSKTDATARDATRVAAAAATTARRKAESQRQRQSHVLLGALARKVTALSDNVVGHRHLDDARTDYERATLIIQRGRQRREAQWRQRGGNPDDIAGDAIPPRPSRLGPGGAEPRRGDAAGFCVFVRAVMGAVARANPWPGGLKIPTHDSSTHADELEEQSFESIVGQLLASKLLRNAPARPRPTAPGSVAGGTPERARMPRVGVATSLAGPSLPNRSLWLRVAAGKRRFYTFNELAGVLLQHYRAVHSSSTDATVAIPASFGASADLAGAGADLAELDKVPNCSAVNDRSAVKQQQQQQQQQRQLSLSSQFTPIEVGIHSEHDVLSAAITQAHASQGMAVPYPYGVGDWVRHLMLPHAQLHRDVAAMLRMLVTQDRICADRRDAFILVDDDVTWCPGAEVHIDAIVRWLQQAKTPPVYIRLAMGFLGTIFHCSHLSVILEHFERLALSNGPAPKYDQRLATAFPDHGMVYRWHLLQVGPSSQPSEDGGGGNGDGAGDASDGGAHAHGPRFTQPPRCYDLQLDAPLGTMARPSDHRLFAFPECKLHVGSPCDANVSFDRPPLVLNELSVAAPGWPAVPPQFVPRWFEPVGALAGVAIGLAELGQSCDMHCQSRNARCTDGAMQEANTIHAVEALLALEEVTSDAGVALKCRTVSGAYHDVDGEVAFTPRIDTATGDCVLLVQPQVVGWCSFVPRWQHLREPDHFRRVCGCQR